MRQILLDEKAFGGTKEPKKFILLGNESTLDEEFHTKIIEPKIKREISFNSKDFWGTLGNANDTPVDWNGYLEISGEGNEEIIDKTLISEIDLIKEVFPNVTNDKIIERFISFKHITFNFPPEFTYDEIPEIRFTLMLEQKQGALVFYYHEDETGKNPPVIEYILPEPTKDNETKDRDRLSYFFKALPDYRYEEVSNKPGVFRLSATKISNAFTIRILTFERGDFNNSLEVIKEAKKNIFVKLGLYKHQRILFYKRRKGDFVKAKNGNIDPNVKTLFLMHGTFGSTESSFGDLYKKSNWLNDLLDDNVYQQVIAYEHPTLFFGAKGNIDAMFKELAELGITRFKEPVDFIGTSQGGLLVQYLANLKQKDIKVGKAVLVASANGVDYLTVAQNVPKFLTYLKYLAKSTGALKASMICAIAQHSVNFLLKQPGFELMKPGSKKLLSIIYEKPKYPGTTYLPVIDDYDESLLDDGTNWKKLLITHWIARGIDVFARLIMGKFNDWVVASQKQFKVPVEYCALPNYNPADYEPYLIKSVHGHCLDKPAAFNMIDEFLTNYNPDHGRKFDASRFTMPIHNDLPPSTPIRYDAHCHILSREDFYKRMLMLFIDAAKDFDFNKIKDKAKPEDSEKEKSDKIRILKLLEMLLLNKDGKDTFSELHDEYLKVDPSVQIFIPLMVDFEYLFRTRYKAENAADIQKRKEQIKEFFGKFNSIRDIIKGIIDKDKSSIGKGIIELLSGFLKETEDTANHNNKKVIDAQANKDLKAYNNQLKTMRTLKRIHGGNFLPFLAVDPRRPGMMDIIIDNVGKGKTFAGIKLYPPMGYSPTDPFLMKQSPANTPDKELGVYEFCVKYNIPIITHCSSGGFCNFVQHLEVIGHVMPDMQFSSKPVEYKDVTEITFKSNIFNGFGTSVKERAYRLNHPKLWEIVLNKFKTLRIDLAHFGGDGDEYGNERREYIFKLLQATENGKPKYPNLYTDLSCIMEADLLTDIFENKYSKLKDRFMYGSDFFLNLIWGKDFKAYYQNFRSAFNGDFDKIAIENTERFLSGKVSVTPPLTEPAVAYN